MNKVKLKELVTIFNGSTPSTSDSDNFEGDISWITPKDLSDQKSKYVKFGERNISEKGLKEIGGKLLPKGTILFSSRAPIGLMSISEIETTTNQGFKNMVCKKDKIINEYLYYLLKTQIAKIQELGTGTTFKEVSKTTIENFELYIQEDIPTQQKIASVLSALDDKIEVNNKINAELEAMTKTLYDYWFVQFDFPNEDSKPYKSSGGKMVYNKTLKREIPEGWEVTVFNDWIKETKTGDWGKENIEGNYTARVYCVRGADINGLNGKGEVKAPERFILQNNLSKKLEPNDFIIEISGGSPTQSTARIALLTKESFDRFDTDVVCSNFCKAVTLKDEAFAFNFQQEWQRLYDAGVFFGFEGKTSGIKNFLFESFMESYHIVKPNKDLVLRYSSIAKELEKKKQSNLKQNQELAQLRDWLLPMLMNGQVRVSEVGIGDRINEYANSEVSHERLVAETFGEYLPKKQHNINDINKELAALIYLMNYGLGANYGNVAVQKAVYNSSVITPNLYSKKHDFINYNFGTFSKGLADDLSHNPYLKTKKINGFEVYEIEPSKKNEILNVLSSAENKDFVSSINKLIDLYRQPFINKETNKMELLNTVLKIYSDLKTTDIKIIYQTMKDWKIKQTGFNTKAEKFSKQDTQQMIELLLRNNILR